MVASRFLLDRRRAAQGLGYAGGISASAHHSSLEVIDDLNHQALQLQQSGLALFFRISLLIARRITAVRGFRTLASARLGFIPVVLAGPIVIRSHKMQARFASHVGPLVDDAAERVRASDLCVVRSLQAMASVRANFAITQVRIDQSAALITAADKLILALDREIISRPDSAAALLCVSQDPDMES